MIVAIATAMIFTPIVASIMVFFMAFLTPLLTPRMEVPMGIVAETHVDRHVRPPIRMIILPPLEAAKSHRVADDPDIARAQIIALVAHITYVFVTVPAIIVRYVVIIIHHHRRSGRGRRYGFSVDAAA